MYVESDSSNKHKSEVPGFFFSVWFLPIFHKVKTSSMDFQSLSNLSSAVKQFDALNLPIAPTLDSRFPVRVTR